MAHVMRTRGRYLERAWTPRLIIVCPGSSSSMSAESRRRSGQAFAQKPHVLGKLAAHKTALVVSRLSKDC